MKRTALNLVVLACSAIGAIRYGEFRQCLGQFKPWRGGCVRGIGSQSVDIEVLDLPSYAGRPQYQPAHFDERADHDRQDEAEGVQLAAHG